MDAIDETLVRELYAVAPDDFLAKRAELARRAEATGDTASATGISKLRKPTVAAWIVNAFALHDPSCLERITEMGDNLRVSQHKLDAPALRALSQQRRSLVGDLTGRALELGQRVDPSTTLRDEVYGTFDAAVADPDVAARLGRLQRAEQFSGFGFPAGGPPQLTLVRGGKDDKPARPTKPKASAAETRAHKQALSRAQDDADRAEAELEQAQQDEARSASGITKAERALAEAKQALEAARIAHDDARQAVRDAKSRRRDARRALDRVGRDAPG